MTSIARLLPAGHVLILVHWNVGGGDVIVGAKVAVRGAEPLLEAMLEGVVLRLLAQVPGIEKEGGGRGGRRKGRVEGGWEGEIDIVCVFVLAYHFPMILVA